MIVLPSLTLTAPDGTLFTTEFIENDVKIDFRVQQMHYSGVDGTDAVMHGANGRQWSFTHYFTGVNYLEEAARFENTIRKPNGGGSAIPRALNKLIAAFGNGRWAMLHPTEGKIDNLVPLSYSRVISPVKSTCVAEAVVEWVEALEDKTLAGADSVMDAINAAKGIQFLQKAGATLSAVISTIRGCTDLVKNAAGLVAAGLKQTLDTFNNLIDTAISFVELGPLFASGLHILYDYFIDTYTEKAAVLNAFGKMGDAFIAEMKNLATNNGGDSHILDTDAVNKAITVKAFGQALIAAMASVIADGGFTSREEALAFLKDFRSFSERWTTALEGLDSASAANDIEKQFLPEAEADNQKLLGAITAYVLGTLWEMNTQGYYTLDRDMPALAASIMVNASTARTVDDDFDKFMTVNHIYGYDILLLRKGTIVRSIR
jgi:hypothetical protein